MNNPSLVFAIQTLLLNIKNYINAKKMYLIISHKLHYLTAGQTNAYASYNTSRNHFHVLGILLYVPSSQKMGGKK